MTHRLIVTTLILLAAATAGDAEIGGQTPPEQPQVGPRSSRRTAAPRELPRDARPVATGFAGHFACRTFVGSARELAIAVSDERADVVHRLVQAGADVNCRSQSSHTRGMTLLQVAIWYGWGVESVDLLLAAGADCEAKDPRGDTAIILASGGRPAVDDAVVRRLIEAGADVNAHGARGMTPLMHAALYDDSTAALSALLRAGAEVDARDAAGWTALMHATRRRRESASVVRLLIEAGADVNARHKHGGTPLISACYSGQADVAETLLRAGADIDAADEAGWTPLIGATMGGHRQAVETLLRAGADLQAHDRLGRTALSIAQFGQHRKIAARLTLAGAHEPRP